MTLNHFYEVLTDLVGLVWSFLKITLPTHSEIRLLFVVIVSTSLSNHFYAFGSGHLIICKSLPIIPIVHFSTFIARLDSYIFFWTLVRLVFFFRTFFYKCDLLFKQCRLWKHAFSSPLCRILKSLLIEILEIMITIRKKKEKPKVRC